MNKIKNSANKNVHPVRPGFIVSFEPLLRVMAGVLLLVVVVFAAYLPSISGGFVLDDNLLLTENTLIRAPDGLYGFWCTTEASDYWPVTNTALWIEWRLWGMHPAGYHVTSLILHIVETLLIWLILRKLSIPGAFLAAMIFSVHPVNVESVAWISQRKNTMAMLFFLLSILWYLKHLCSRHTPCADPTHGVCGVHKVPAHGVRGLLSGHWYWLSLVAFVLAMLSKGSVAVLPVLLLEIVWWQRPLTRWDLLRTAPFFAVAIVLAVVNVWFQSHGTDEVFRTAGFVERLLGAGGVVWFYLYKALLPFDLTFVYQQWNIQAGNPLWWLPLLAALVVTVVLWSYRKGWGRPLLFAWGFFCVSLVPVIGFTDVGFMKFSLVADRYQHIAIIGVIALVGAVWNVWFDRARGAVHWPAITVAFTAVGALAFLTWRQSELYNDAITLYQATLVKNPNCWMAENNLGSTLFNKVQLPEAIEHYRQALCLKPDYAEAFNNMGVTLVQLNRIDEAIEHYREALRIKPKYIEVYNNLGFALALTGRFNEAIEQCGKALQLKPDFPEAHNNLGAALDEIGLSDEAIEHCQEALRLRPDYAEAHYNLGLALARSGRPPEAIDQYEQALRQKPDYPEAHFNLGNVFLKSGRFPEAIEQYQQALRLKPYQVNTHLYLAMSYAGLHQSAEAVTAAGKALELARSQGQTGQAKQIEDWLNSYRK